MGPSPTYPFATCWSPARSPSGAPQCGCRLPGSGRFRHGCVPVIAPCCRCRCITLPGTAVRSSVWGSVSLGALLRKCDNPAESSTAVISARSRKAVHAARELSSQEYSAGGTGYAPWPGTVGYRIDPIRPFRLDFRSDLLFWVGSDVLSGTVKSERGGGGTLRGYPPCCSGAKKIARKGDIGASQFRPCRQYHRIFLRDARAVREGAELVWAAVTTMRVDSFIIKCYSV